MRKLFGTDGVRGIANKYPMTPEIALKIGIAVGKYFESKNKKSKVVIGKDTRISSYTFENALAAGLCSAGADVIAVGPMPTPAVSHLTRSFTADAGIVISASHNPAEHNGIKFFSAEGFKLPDSVEEEIEGLVFSDVDTSDIIGNQIGRVFRINDAAGRYIEFAKSSARDISLNGLKIVLDCANGAAYKISPSIFSELGVEVIVLNNHPDGMNINLNCGALYPQEMVDAVKKHKADLGIALDGDADRAIFCDENGEIIDGDEILAIAAIEMKKKGILKKDTIVATHMSNPGLELSMKEHSIKVVRTDVGDRYVMDEMRAHGYNLGGEQSGHIIFAEYSTTGDGTIAALQMLKIMKETGKPLSQLKKCMTKFPQILINVEVKDKNPIEKMPSLLENIKKFEKELNGFGRIFVRYSGTQNLMRILVEGKDAKQINAIANQLVDIVKRELGTKRESGSK